MRNLLKSLLVVALVPGLCLAQAPATTTNPPLVPAPAPEAATPPPPGSQVSPAPGAVPQGPSPGTPPPPGYVGPPNGVAPPYSTQGPTSPFGTPYGQPAVKPGPEVGLMISESLFGMLTAAATTLLPYFLLLNPDFGGLWGPPGSSTTLPTILTIVIFGATPLGVSQTQLSLANGSRYYQVESWPPALAGLVTQGIILGVFAASGGFNDSSAFKRGAVPLLVSSIVAVPLAEMVAINFFKYPKGGSGFFGGLNYSPKDGLRAGLPVPSPVVGQTRAGVSSGVSFSVASGRF